MDSKWYKIHVFFFKDESVTAMATESCVKKKNETLLKLEWSYVKAN